MSKLTQADRDLVEEYLLLTMATKTKRTVEVWIEDVMGWFGFSDRDGVEACVRYVIETKELQGLILDED